MKFFLIILLLFVAVDALIIGYVIYRRTRRRLPDKVIQKVRTAWKELIHQNDHRHAIMDADKLLDYALGEMGHRGNLGNKLKKAPKLFSDLNGLWQAHKVRNNIAHQIAYKVDEKTYKKSMLSFKRAFQDLKFF